MEKVWYAHGIEHESAKINVICFPYAGGTASNFARWKKSLDKEHSIYPVLYPLRERRYNENMPDSIEALVTEFVDENLKLFEKPFILFGHCTGSIIAYETARYIHEKLKKEPICFIASGALSPDKRLVQMDVDNMKDNDFIEMLNDTGRIAEGAELIPNFKEYYLPVIRADYHLLGMYNYEASYKMSCQVITLAGTEDKQISFDDISNWRKFTDGKYENYSMAGGHFFIEKNVEEICKIVNEIGKRVKR